MIILKKIRNDIWKNYNNDYFILISDFSKYDILKYNFINIIIIIEKKKLINKIKHYLINHVNRNRLIVIKNPSHFFLNIRIITLFLAYKLITTLHIILFIIFLNCWKFKINNKIDILDKVVIIIF